MTNRHTINLSSLSPKHQAQALEQGVKPDTALGKLQLIGKRQSKHGNIRCVDADGRPFDSRKEMADFHKLVMAHGIKNVIRQVSIPLDDRPPIQRMRPDFLVIHEIFADGTFRGELLDSKGCATADWKRKAKKIKVRHGLIVRTI